MHDTAALVGEEHWTSKGDVRLFLWRKHLPGAAAPHGPVLFVHGSSMASQPCFDLQVPGQPELSIMDVLARHGFDAWCFDCEGYGRSDKSRDINCDVANGADDVAAAVAYILATTGAPKLSVYGGSSGALRAAMFAERAPDLIRRLVLDALVWTGDGSPTLAERRKRLPEYQANNRRPLDPQFVRGIFDRDHPGSADEVVVAAFAAAVVALDTSIPNGTYVDMCSKLPLLDPTRLNVPVLILRGEWDGIASFEDVAAYFARLPNPDKQLAVLPGVAHSSFHGKNHALARHVLLSFLTQPAPVYTGA